MFECIEVTDKRGIVVCINVAHIIRFKDHEHSEDGPTTYGYIKMTTGEVFCAQNREQIYNLLVNMETL